VRVWRRLETELTRRNLKGSWKNRARDMPCKKERKMDTNVLPEELNHVENWWWDRSSAVRWLLGSVSLAAMAGVLGGMLA
jgi:hypothetical protein